MELPFKNGYELAQYFGYGDLYAAAEKKDQQQNEERLAMKENFQNMTKKIDKIFKRNIQETID